MQVASHAEPLRSLPREHEHGGRGGAGTGRSDGGARDRLADGDRVEPLKEGLPVRRGDDGPMCQQGAAVEQCPRGARQGQPGGDGSAQPLHLACEGCRVVRRDDERQYGFGVRRLAHGVRPGRFGRRLFEDQVGIGAADAERGDAGPAGPAVLGPRTSLMSRATLPADQSTCGVGSSTKRVAGSTPCVRAPTILITEVTPAAAWVWPRLDLTVPSHSGRSGERSRP